MTGDSPCMEPSKWYPNMQALDSLILVIDKKLKLVRDRLCSWQLRPKLGGRGSLGCGERELVGKIVSFFG